MKKRTLEIEYSFDFELLGIISSAKGYKLAWEINNALNVRLVRQEDLVVSSKKIPESQFSHFSYENEVNILKLFRNRPSEGDSPKGLLIAEFPHFDYILLSQGEEHMKSKRLQELLRNIPSIELVAFIPLGALKSKENFIF